MRRRGWGWRRLLTESDVVGRHTTRASARAASMCAGLNPEGGTAVDADLDALWGAGGLMLEGVAVPDAGTEGYGGCAAGCHCGRGEGGRRDFLRALGCAGLVPRFRGRSVCYRG